jgi:hypothetical protein
MGVPDLALGFCQNQGNYTLGGDSTAVGKCPLYVLAAANSSGTYFDHHRKDKNGRFSIEKDPCRQTRKQNAYIISALVLDQSDYI